MKFQNVLGILALGTALVAPAVADVSVKEILQHKRGVEINVRVTVDNPARTPQRGPVKISLWVRPDSNAKWQQIKVWNDIREIHSGQKISRDIFAQNSRTLRIVARNPNWEAKATVTAPGVHSDTKTVAMSDQGSGSR